MPSQIPRNPNFNLCVVAPNNYNTQISIVGHIDVKRRKAVSCSQAAVPEQIVSVVGKAFCILLLLLLGGEIFFSSLHHSKRDAAAREQSQVI